VATNPELFTTRADGSIAYAENPPKKYQDMYPLNFDNDPEGAYAEMRRVVQVWIDHGVKIFRVDNPHTKPVEFWEWLIADVALDHPEVIWLAEAFTRPPMMHTLAKVGFQQSYTYYAWRHTRWERIDYCKELAGPAAPYMRPSFWPTTHDILTPFMQHGGPTAWKMRAALAVTLVPTYGIYAGYELVEDVARPGAEEQMDKEKYQFKDRPWSDYQPGGPKEGQSIAAYLTRVNQIRRAHPALYWLRNLHFHDADDENIIVFSKARTLYDRQDVILVVAYLDPHHTRDTWIHLDMPALGLQGHDGFVAHDLITGEHWNWGQHDFVRLGPALNRCTSSACRAIDSSSRARSMSWLATARTVATFAHRGAASQTRGAPGVVGTSYRSCTPQLPRQAAAVLAQMLALGSLLDAEHHRGLCQSTAHAELRTVFRRRTYQQPGHPTR
jgi:starch synthase (maltosyl-transferring)